MTAPAIVPVVSEGVPFTADYESRGQVMTSPAIVPVVSEVVPFTADDRQKLNEIHAAITSISEAVQSLPLDKLSKSPVFRMLGF